MPRRTRMRRRGLRLPRQCELPSWPKLLEEDRLDAFRTTAVRRKSDDACTVALLPDAAVRAVAVANGRRTDDNMTPGRRARRLCRVCRQYHHRCDAQIGKLVRLFKRLGAEIDREAHAVVLINAPAIVRRMAAGIREAGARPEIECFDLGDLVLANKLIAEDALDGPGLFSFVCGVNYAIPFSPAVKSLAQSMLPSGAQWTGFAIGKNAFPAVALSWLLGGHVRTGLEDTIYLAKGELAKSNAALVKKAAQIVNDLGGELASASEARELL